jgi:hypothetical protein
VNSLDTCAAARAVFTWAFRWGHIERDEHDALQRAVARREHLHRVCKSKAAYVSRAFARKVIGRRHIDKQKWLDTYQCEECGQWHIGSTSTLKRRERAAFRMRRREEEAYA